MEIKILGGGCPRCKRLEKLTREVVEELGAEATFGHVTEMAEIMEYDITSTPALVIDGDVKVSGRIPPKADIEGWVREAQA
jgi:small redox-active disulfide protein 2